MTKRHRNRCRQQVMKKGGFTMLKTVSVAATLSLMASVSHAADRWDGADELEVSPLGCEAGAAPTVVAKDYDGGLPTSPPDRAGKDITVMDVPKLIGIGYFAATNPRHAGSGSRTRQCQRDDRWPDRGEYRRSDHLSRQTSSPKAWTVYCLQPMTPSRSPQF